RLRDYGPISDEALVARAEIEIAANQVKAGSGKAPIQAVDPGCQPLRLTAPVKRRPQPEARAALPPSASDYVRIETEGTPPIFASPDTAEWLQSLKEKGNAQAIWFGVGSSFVAVGTAQVANQTAGTAVQDTRATVGKAPIDNTPRSA